ncbi:hypothetical protein DFH06DRAFT_1398184, partial [Mycena polygramma]
EPVVWFWQTVRNACGLFALLHAVSNLSPTAHQSISQCFFLSIYFSAQSLLSGLLNAQRRSNTRTALHRCTTVLHSSPRLDEVPGHYLCFVRSPKDGHISELDGGKNGPVDHDEFLGGDRDMLSGGLKLVQDFVRSKLDPANPHFHLVALVPSSA